MQLHIRKEIIMNYLKLIIKLLKNNLHYYKIKIESPQRFYFFRKQKELFVTQHKQFSDVLRLLLLERLLFLFFRIYCYFTLIL